MLQVWDLQRGFPGWVSRFSTARMLRAMHANPPLRFAEAQHARLQPHLPNEPRGVSRFEDQRPVDRTYRKPETTCAASVYIAATVVHRV